MGNMSAYQAGVGGGTIVGTAGSTIVGTTGSAIAGTTGGTFGEITIATLGEITIATLGGTRWDLCGRRTVVILSQVQIPCGGKSQWPHQSCQSEAYKQAPQ
jgi:hypothetical protein